MQGFHKSSIYNTISMKHHRVKHSRRRYAYTSDFLGMQPNFPYSLKHPELIPTCSQGENWGYGRDKRRKESERWLLSYLSFPVDNISDVTKRNIQPPRIFDLRSPAFWKGKGPIPWPAGVWADVNLWRALLGKSWCPLRRWVPSAPSTHRSSMASPLRSPA